MELTKNGAISDTETFYFLAQLGKTGKLGKFTRIDPKFSSSLLEPDLMNLAVVIINNNMNCLFVD